MLPAMDMWCRKTDWNIREATHSAEKPDSTTMIRNGRPVWPSGEAFQYEIEVAFGHVPEEPEINPRSIQGSRDLSSK
ncbi:hypothetical protein I7I51_07625 [Histoplasma capsulatum]|uniref:Uncharacterized protein n=1 Tax=Ajellomyces capsulatus TaxID=5037 RepID=A0A8A1M194_AJECA|nr:hypothetical protein I7I51_07625 [Histoplasma capsulatum]